MDRKDISKLKQRARTLKRDASITHSAALDLVAREAGAKDWAQLMRQSATAQAAPVRVLPIPKSRTEIFHRVEIEGMDFTAAVHGKHGLFLQGPKITWDTYEGEVSLGVCRISYFRDAEPHYRVGSNQWWVCKYQGEARINVTALSDLGRLALAREFGLATGQEEADDYGERFQLSPAFSALVAWVEHHPTIAKRAGAHGNPYVPDWYARAVGDISPGPATTLQ
jgi:hypothetical protein